MTTIPSAPAEPTRATTIAPLTDAATRDLTRGSTTPSRRAGRYPLALDGSIFGWVAGAEQTGEVLDGFARAGGSIVSTADHYAGGRSEIMIGHWIDTVADRSSIVVATKVGKHPDYPVTDAPSLLAAVDASLVRLRTDRIDVLSFDGDLPGITVDDLVDAAHVLASKGRVGRFSASSLSDARFDRIDGALRAAGLAGFEAVFSEYSLVRREPFESHLAPLVRDRALDSFARLPLAGGFLTGAYRSRTDLPDSPMFVGALDHVGRKGKRVLSEVESIADELGTTAGAVALAWVVGAADMTFAVVRAKDLAQLDGHVSALAVDLTRHHRRRLDRASA
ncbi:aldo/keto reductase [Marisediminicola sp. LYQ85]|uniref:aldo/keto reductase n=1 Tax=Marisediminicola sp. LYQ85 TaxID=3391062 RepID=UPI003983D854